MDRKYDVIVVGLGAVGSAALYQLSKTSATVAGIDSLNPPHDKGSSHGQSRLTRQAIGEGSVYTPLALRSNELWRQIEREIGRRLLSQNGGLIYGAAGSTEAVHGVQGFLQETVKQAERYSVVHEILDAAAIQSRYPQFKVGPGDVGYFEPGAGYLVPEECIRAQLLLAETNGATIVLEQPVRAIDASGGTARIRTSAGILEAEQVILAAGKWIRSFLPPCYKELLKVFPQIQGWFATQDSRVDWSPQRMPVFVRLPSPGEKVVYGFPATDAETGLVKMASEQFDHADELEGQELEKVLGDLRRAALTALDVSGPPVRTVKCAYTVTPDGHFLVDRHPDFPNVLVASACSGHGFKHSAAVGELLKDWICGGSANRDLAAFSFKRFRDVERTDQTK